MFRNTLKTTIELAGFGGLMVAIGSLFGRGGAVIGLGLGLAIVGFSYWKSDALAIRRGCRRGHGSTELIARVWTRRRQWIPRSMIARRRRWGRADISEVRGYVRWR
ncbi:MAG: hypothetical protein ACRD0U_04050 [Acidimicrobiales bacterium]